MDRRGFKNFNDVLSKISLEVKSGIHNQKIKIKKGLLVMEDEEKLLSSLAFPDGSGPKNT